MSKASAIAYILVFIFYSTNALANVSPLSRLQRQPDSPLADLQILQIYAQYPTLGADATREQLEEALSLHKLPNTAKVRAQYLLAKILLNTGHPTEAAEQIRQLGFITDWQITGPYPNRANSGLQTAFRIERDRVTTDDFPSCTEHPSQQECAFPSSWLSRRLGENILQHVFSPSRQICVYAQTEIRSNNESEQILFFGASGQSKLFWNGEPLYTDENTYSYGADINRFRIPLKTKNGENTLTVKNCTGLDGEISFFARLETTDGTPLHEFSKPAHFRIPLLNNDEPHTPRKTVLTLLEKSAATALRRNASDTQKTDYAAYALLTDAIGKNHVPRDVARSACFHAKNWEACSTYAKIIDAPNEQRAAYEAVLAQHPVHPQAEVALLALDMNQMGDTDVARRLSSLSEKYPSNPTAQCALLQYLSNALPRAALAHQQTLHNRFSIPLASTCVAESLIKRPAHKYAAEYIDAAKNAEYENLDWHLRALALHPKVSSQAPMSEMSGFFAVGAPTIDQLLEAVQWIKNSPSSKAPRRFFIDVLRHAPRVWQYHKEAGLFYLEQNEQSNGFRQLHYALELAPQNTALREMLSYIDPQPPFYQPYVVDSETFTKLSSQCDTQDDACQLVQNTVVQVYPNGLTSKFTQVVVKINSRSGARQWQQYSEQFSSSQHLDLVAARLYRKNGVIEEATGRATFPVSEPWYRLYYDVEAEVVELPKPNTGDIVEFQFRVDDISDANWYDGYFGTILPLQQHIPIKQWDAVIIHPVEMRLYMDIPSRIAHRTETSPRGETVDIYHASKLPRIPDEPLVSGATSLVDQLHLSTYSEWFQMRDWFRELVQAQLAANDEIKQAVIEITRDQKTEREKISAVYHWVTDHIRYVGLEFGIHGYQPYAVNEIFSRGFGDCKDTASLIVAMLKTIQVDAHIALVRTRSAGPIQTRVPSLSVFNHAIAYVPKYNLWLDGTAKRHGTTEFPFEDQGVASLIIDRSDSGLVETPYRTIDDSSYAEQQYFKIDDHGNADVSIKITATGVFAPWFRTQFDVADSQRVLEKELSLHFTGIHIDDSSFVNFDQYEQTPMITYSAHIPHFGTSATNRIRFPALTPINLRQKFGSVNKRSHDLQLGPLKNTHIRAEFEIPPTYRIISFPKDIHLQSSFGELAISVKVSERKIIVERKFHFNQVMVPANTYRQFVRFCIEVDKAMQQNITVEKE
ncbi:MAG: DUF3857 domain-containing protein [Deltaproteobacteria bacterium]|nr:DUF3857 domain-containing protein [Deltaproteobacteria bacterium]MBN2671940.1 DUF3857 domain-containing protein [Deltaproteobacteria bacterium]